MTTDTKLPENVGAAAQARRLYMHVCNGGAVTPSDIGRMVATIEKLEAALARQEPVVPPAAQAVDLSIFRDAVEYAHDYGSERKRPERGRLLSLIDQQAGKEVSDA